MAALATVADLGAYGVVVSGPETAVVERMLDDVSASIRAAAQSNITETTTTVRVFGAPDCYLTLPGRPVTDVADVLTEGDATDDWTLVHDRLWRAGGWRWTARPLGHDVTFTSGLPEAPADIVHLAVSLVTASLLEYREACEAGTDGATALAARDTSITSASYAIDDYQESVTYQQAANATAQATRFDLPESTRRWLRKRFGPGGVTWSPLD